MPIYEYQCESCGTIFELRQTFAAEPLTVHENCGGPVHRLISAPALQFKGTGWYITDYAKGNGSKPAPGKAEGSASAENASKSEGSGKSESSKPESKADSSSSSSSSSSASSSTSTPAKSSDK